MAIRKNWLWVALVRLLSTQELSFEEERKRVFYSVLAVSSSAMLLTFGTFHILADLSLEGFINWAIAVWLLLSLKLIRSRESGLAFYRSLPIAVGLLFVYFGTIGEIHGNRILWLYTYPSAVYLLLGRKDGLAYSLLLLGVWMGFLFLPTAWTGAFEYEPGYSLRFVATFIMILAMGWFSESVRIMYQEAILERNEELENDKRRLADSEGKMRELAHNDTLTGISNRRAVLAVLGAKMRNAKDNPTLAVGLFDIDNFKSINDTWGHPVGDEVLLEVARRIKANIRKEDMVGRYGGEEFLILLDSPAGEGVFGAFDKLRECIASIPIDTTSGLISVTASFGAAVPVPSQNTDDLIKRADQALYLAKEQGRNLVVVAE